MSNFLPKILQINFEHALKIFFEKQLHHQFNKNQIIKTNDLRVDLIKSSVQFQTIIPQLPNTLFKPEFYKTNQKMYTSHQMLATRPANKLEFMFNRIKNVLGKNNKVSKSRFSFLMKKFDLIFFIIFHYQRLTRM